MSTIIEDYLRDVRSRLPHLGVRERDAVLKEIDDHLRSEVRRLRSEDKRLSADEAALRATNAFGDPADIGVAHGAQGGVVNRSTGERLLEVAVLTSRAAGRGVRGALKWTGISALILLGVGLVVFIALLIFAGNVVETYQDDIRDNVPRPLYSYEGSWGAGDPHTDVVRNSFEVPSHAREFRIRIDISPGAEPSGCAHIMLVSPDNDVAYDSGAGCGRASQTLTLHEQGTWKVVYTFVAFHGSVDVEAYYFGAPSDTEPDGGLDEAPERSFLPI